MKKTFGRFIILAVALLSMMGALIMQLGKLTLAQGQEFTENADEKRFRTEPVKGMRGRIMDRNGVVLAYSETCYNVEFIRDPEQLTSTDSALYTDSIIKAIGIVEKYGGKTIDTFYIRKNEQGQLYYDWRVESEAAVKARYKNFCDAMGFYIPPEAQDDMTKWKSAEEAYLILRKSWQIPESMPYKEAAKIMAIRQEAVLNGWQAYLPVTIAYDVSLDAVAEIDMMADELYGIKTSQSTTRIYPRGTTAAHIVGYLSRSADEEMVKSKGYSYDDMIGAAGVESYMESYLTGATTERQGSRTYEVNKYGSVIREMGETPAKDGNDVMLTIDLRLQIATDQALEHVIQYINDKERRLIEDDQKRPENERKYEDPDSIDLAETGSIVVMDVNTGQVLAMSSYPSFDPNMFIKGLSPDEAKLLFNSEYSAKTTPMRNKAISAKSAPGSIFKMVTGLAGLMEGAVGLNEQIDDGGYYYVTGENGEKITANAPKCHIFPSVDKHKDQDIVAALTNSCNYYFFTVAERLGITKLDEWAQKLGLTTPTGIELPGEATGMVGGQKVLYDNTLPLAEQKTSMPRLVYNLLCERLKYYVTSRSMEVDENAIKACADKLMRLQDGSLTGKGAEVRSILSEELGIPEGITSVQPWTQEVTSMLSELQWKATITVRSGIGQGVTLVTPIAVARYASAIANKGTVYDVHIVDRILDSDGKLVKEIEPSVYNQIDAPEEYWNAIHQGLRGVMSPEDRGTAAQAFSDSFQNEGYQDLIIGKTGTAQTTTANQIDIENTSWFITFTPREKPEIAIVVSIPNGFSGSSSAPAVEEIVRYYIDRSRSSAPENLVDVNALVP